MISGRDSRAAIFAVVLFVFIFLIGWGDWFLLGLVVAAGVVYFLGTSVMVSLFLLITEFLYWCNRGYCLG